MNSYRSSSLITYIVGYCSSLFLIVTAYILTTHQLFAGRKLLIMIAGLAIVQMLVQAICFLHMGKESRPRWNLLLFSFMLVVVVIVIFGSIWIMYNLNYNHTHDPYMTPGEISKDEGINP